MLHPGGEETEAGPQPQLPASAETTGAQTVTSSIHLSPPPDAASNPSAPAQTDQLECKADSPQNLQAQQATGRFPQTDSPQQANMDWCNESQLPQELHMLGQLPRSSAVTMQLADDSCEAMQWQATDAVALQQPQPAQQHLEANARQLTPAGPHQKQQPVLAGLLTGSHRADPDPEPFHQSAHDHPLDDGNSATAGQLPTAAEATQQVTQDSSAQLATGY